MASLKRRGSLCPALLWLEAVNSLCATPGAPTHPAGLRPPMPSMGGPPMPGFQQQQQQPPQQQAPPPGMGMPGMQPPMMQQQHLLQQQQQQPPMGGMGMLPQQPGMGMAPPGMGGMGPPMPGMQMQPPRPPMPGMAPPMPVPGMQAQAQATTSSKIDPSQIPRPMPYAIPTQVCGREMQWVLGQRVAAAVAVLAGHLAGWVGWLSWAVGCRPSRLVQQHRPASLAPRKRPPCPSFPTTPAGV